MLLASLLLSLALGTVRGIVVESRTGVPLAAVLVTVQDTRQQAVSDAEGRFEIGDVPEGPHTLVVSVVGYGLVRQEVVVRSGAAVEVTLAVAEGASTYVETVTVGAPVFRDADPGVASQAVLGSRDLLALRGVIADDPFRAVQALPEVATGDDFRAEFAVRGLGPSHTGIALDGVDTPLLFHTVRGVNDAGSLALINTDVLESATLLAGAYPQRAGAHLGARLDFTTRDGARDRTRGRTLVGVTALTGVFEGPLPRGRPRASDGDAAASARARGSWLVALRKSYLDWLLREIDPEIDGTFGFTDGQAKVAFDLTNRQLLRATIVSGRSVLNELDDEPGPNTLDRATNRSVIANLQWRYLRSPRLVIDQQVYLVDAGYRNRVVGGRVREEGGDRDVTWRGSVTTELSRAHAVDAGVQAQWLRARRVDRAFTASASATLVDVRESWTAAGAWAHYRWTPTPALQVSPGVRADRSSLTRASALSPYLLAEWRAAPAWRLRASLGRQHQLPVFDQAIFSRPMARVLEAERAWTADAGVEWRAGESWRVRFDGYRREESDRMRFEQSEARMLFGRPVRPGPAFWANALSGTASGAVVTVERRRANGLSGWVSYSAGRTELRDRLTGERYVSDYDQAHTVNAYGLYRTSGRLSLSARYRYGSNFPLAGYLAPMQGDVYRLAEDRNGVRLPAYSRADARVDWAFTYRRSRLTLFVEVLNALNRQNLGPGSPTIRLSTGAVTDATRRLFPLLPSAGFLVEF